MRQNDLERLSREYDPNEPPAGRLARALGIDLPNWRALRDQIFSDLDEQRFGIGWWAPHLDTQRRILISDYLFVCADSVETNMIEAKLHLLEATDFWERENELYARSVTIGPGGQIRSPVRRCPIDDIQARMPRLHAVGVVRALASALDCFGAVIVGVAALPEEILRAGFGRARRALGRVADSSPGAQAQRTLCEQLKRAIAEAGPSGWPEWLMDLRNMYVHRGRRLDNPLLRRVPSGIIGPDGRSVIRPDRVPLLPRNPGWSDVQVFLKFARDRPVVLTENAEVTLRGVLESTARLLDQGGKLLLELWSRRRADPQLLPQPSKQWPRIEPAGTSGFDGYAPSSVPVQPSAVATHPDVVRRLKAAALSEHDRRAQWSSFD